MEKQDTVISTFTHFSTLVSVIQMTMIFDAKMDGRLTSGTKR